jgi:hypothetical protein
MHSVVGNFGKRAYRPFCSPSMMGLSSVMGGPCPQTLVTPVAKSNKAAIFFSIEMNVIFRETIKL